MSFPFNAVHHFLIDLDGVLYRGNIRLPAADEFITLLRACGISFRLLSNNSTLTPEQYAAKLTGMGISAQPDEILTSALATAGYLRKQGAEGQTAYVIGEHGLIDALRAVEIQVVNDGNSDWVVAGLDRELTYAKLAGAALALESGARFVATNPDTSLPTERGLLPGAGAIQAALTATTGVQPIVVGKPKPLMLELAMEQLGGTTEDTVMLGDRLDTDIAAANALHMRSILVLTGVSTRLELKHSPYQPTIVVDNLSELIKQWEDSEGS